MREKKSQCFFVSRILIFFIFMAMSQHCFAEERPVVNLTTYYPAPYGVYRQMTTETLGVGNNNDPEGLTSEDAPDPATNPGDAWIKGNVGISTINPRASLEVKKDIEDITQYCTNNPDKCFGGRPAIAILEAPTFSYWSLLFDFDDSKRVAGFYKDYRDPQKLDFASYDLSSSTLLPMMEWDLDNGDIYFNKRMDIYKTFEEEASAELQYPFVTAPNLYVKGFNDTTNYKVGSSALRADGHNGLTSGILGIAWDFSTYSELEGVRGTARLSADYGKAYGIKGLASYDGSTTYEDGGLYGVYGQATCTTFPVGRIHAVHGEASFGGTQIGSLEENFGVYGAVQLKEGNLNNCDRPRVAGVYGCYQGDPTFTDTYAGYFDGEIGISGKDDQGIHFFKNNRLYWDGGALIQGYSANSTLALNASALQLNGTVNVNGDIDISGEVVLSEITSTSNSGYKWLRYDNSTKKVYFSTQSPGPLPSSLRYKQNINMLQDNFDKILDLEPKSFVYKDSGEKGIGYIAEDLDDLGFKNLVVYDQQGHPDAIKYDLISVYLLEIIKGQKKTVESQQAQIQQLEDRVKMLENKFAKE